MNYAIVPVEPTIIDTLPLIDGLILDALNEGDPFTQTTLSTLHANPVVITKDDPAATYLRGALAAMPSWPEFIPANEAPQELRGWHQMSRELAAFIAELDRRGALLIGAS